MIVTDADGREFYDCLAGAGTLALGHNHPVVIDAIERMLHEKTVAYAGHHFRD